MTTDTSPSADAPAIDPQVLTADATDVLGAPSEVASALEQAIALSATAPTTIPPSEVEVAVEAAAAAAVWVRGKKVNATWSNRHPRNAYISIEGLGWRRLSPANDSSFVSMAMLGAHAEATGANVDAYIGTDSTVQQLYVW